MLALENSMLITNSEVIQTRSTQSAILDVHFAPNSNIFGAATSTGSVGIYCLKNEPDSGNQPTIEHIKTIQYFSENVLVTAFQWHPTRSSLGLTLSSGQVCLGTVDLREDVGSSLSMDMTRHDLEAWTLTFLPDGSGIYSGGDDSALHFVEMPVNTEYYENFEAAPEYGSIRRMPWVDKKIHMAGVTAILPIESDERRSLVLTGSYDDHLRLIDVPVAGRRTVLAEMNLGGGVWRLKRLDDQSRPTPPLKSADAASEGALLLVSCMHAGTRVVRLRKDAEQQWHFEVLAKFEEHKSMNYGSDCQSSKNDQGHRTFITTSFYDRLLCLWRY